MIEAFLYKLDGSFYVQTKTHLYKLDGRVARRTRKTKAAEDNCLPDTAVEPSQSVTRSTFRKIKGDDGATFTLMPPRPIILRLRQGTPIALMPDLQAPGKGWVFDDHERVRTREIGEVFRTSKPALPLQCEALLRRMNWMGYNRTRIVSSLKKAYL